MSTLELYLLTRLPAIQAAMIILAILSAVAVLFLLVSSVIIMTDRYDDKASIPTLRIGALISTFVLLISSGLAILIPGREDIAIIILGKYVTNSEQIGKLPENLIKPLNEYLESLNEKQESR